MLNKTEQNYIDKTEYHSGPWHSEPDRVSWIDPDTGYACLVRRNDTIGFLCGYVGINKTHPLYEKPSQELDISCHGGLTFSSPCDSDTEKGVCHVTKDEDEAWWFGFDCGHAWDIIPSKHFPLSLFRDSTYRDLNYVISEVECLAKQLKDIENES